MLRLKRLKETKGCVTGPKTQNFKKRDFQSTPGRRKSIRAVTVVNGARQNTVAFMLVLFHGVFNRHANSDDNINQLKYPAIIEAVKTKLNYHRTTFIRGTTLCAFAGSDDRGLENDLQGGARHTLSIKYVISKTSRPRAAKSTFA